MNGSGDRLPCTAAAVREEMTKIAALYGDNFTKVFKTIAFDNGSEFTKLPESLPDIAVYYADPYSSFQRGTNEKQKFLIRRLLPKGRAFDDVSDDVIASIKVWINQLPRKIFNYRSAFKLFVNCPI